MKANGRRRWRKWAKRNGAGRGDFADYRRFRRHRDTTYAGVEGMRPTEPMRRPFSLRSLVGMTMGARKRAARREYLTVCEKDPDHALIKAATLSTWNDGELEAGYQRWHNRQRQIRAKYRLGERLRPCPGCTACLVCVACENNNCRRKHLPVQYCAGDGVLPPMRR